MNLLGEGNDLVAKTAKDCCAWTVHFSNISKGVIDRKKLNSEPQVQCGKTFAGKKQSKEERKKDHPKKKHCCGKNKGRG